MEVTTQELKRCDLITVKGRVDSSTAPAFAKALEKGERKRSFSKSWIDMSGLEYMSSAGFPRSACRPRGIANAIIAAK